MEIKLMKFDELDNYIFKKILDWENWYISFKGVQEIGYRWLFLRFLVTNL